MPLSSSTLAKALAAFAVPGAFPETYVEAGQKWADAYATYAADAQTPWAHATVLDPGVPPLAAALTAAFAGGAAAPAMAAALTAF